MGRPDSILDPVGVRTRFLYDSLGRVKYQKTGTGLTAPTTRNHYGKDGVLDSVSVYSSTDAALATPSGTVQVTRNFYDNLGRLDSTIAPGSRSPVKAARKQSFVRDRFGVPLLEYPGNGTFIGRLTDWQGRIQYVFHNYVASNVSLDGERFASDTAKTVYDTLRLASGRHLSPGQMYTFGYDEKGRLIRDEGTDLFSGKLYLRTKSWSRTGQLVTEDHFH